MKKQGIPEHQINFTGEVSQALDKTMETKQNAQNKQNDQKQSNR
ncbi:hypothetical protein [Bacillus sp. SA1-12]|nr:hypothetical protein [Bacillus sp. SA1-12]